MNQIWKYTLAGDKMDKMVSRAGEMAAFKVSMPKNSMVLSAHTQNGEPTVWALVNTEAEMEDVTFHVFGTGHLCDVAGKEFIGTCLLPDGIVVHVFQL